MEEILASIRRIISEDATPPKLQPLAAQRPTGMTPKAPVFGNNLTGFATAPVLRQPSPAPMRSLEPVRPAEPAPAAEDDDILDLGSNYAAVTRQPLPVPGKVEPVFAPIPVATAAAFAAPPEPVKLPELEPFAAVPVPEMAMPIEVPAVVDATALAAPVELPEATVLAQAEPPGGVVFVPEPAPVEATIFAAASSDPEPEPVPEPLPEIPAMTQAPVMAWLPEPVAQELSIPQVHIDSQPSAQAAQPPVPMLSSPAPRTMEDTITELLKPMLRDWLDANMPRIIEKAMAKEA